MEQSLVLIKPDGVLNRKIGDIVARFEAKGLEIQAMKMMWMDEQLAITHYQEHEGKGFFDDLISYITEAPIVAMVIAGEEAIQIIRNLNGATDPLEAKPGTIRGDFALNLDSGNIVHASDSTESAKREIDLYFDADEIYAYRD
ncbi:nucleoside-diphosphate kinase [Natroniella acetigena]|uniref:nucleoside-diphosphate kinase n=1 Tax=Natroniella acetigena TaxID=52004 RepID=UPI00200B10F6|nr:nucleoside-diphosphate kinase [Natroniella acetigena]MCK8828558.1 nucleoside-diphosphate kinase [Natroniella acetigena]